MTLYAILFIAMFPALWLLAATLDRVWPCLPDSTRHTLLPKDS